MWPNDTAINLLGMSLPIIQAPMAGASGLDMAIAVSRAGGLASLPCAMLNIVTIVEQIKLFRESAPGPLNVNFFCHGVEIADEARTALWHSRLARYYTELGVDEVPSTPASSRQPFNQSICELIEAEKPEVVSFHFGLPEAALLARVKAADCKVISSATPLCGQGSLPILPPRGLMQGS